MSGEKCGAECRDGSPCEAYPVSGSDRCRMHGGQGSGAPESNQNRTTHSLHARKVNAVYQKVFSPEIQGLVDSIYEDYIEDYRERHGEPRTGDKAELFRIAVSYGKHIHSEEWALDKPSDVESGNAFVDREETQKPAGEGFKLTDVQYKQTVVQKGQQSLSQDRRMWLKDLGLLDSPEDRQADAAQDIADAWQSELERGSTE